MRAGRGVFWPGVAGGAAADAATWAPYPMPPSASNSRAEAAQSPQGVGPDTWPYFSMALRYTPSNLVSLLGLLRACFWYCTLREQERERAKERRKMYGKHSKRCTSGRHNSKKQLTLFLGHPTFSHHFSCIQYFVISIYWYATCAIFLLTPLHRADKKITLMGIINATGMLLLHKYSIHFCTGNWAFFNEIRPHCHRW